MARAPWWKPWQVLREAETARARLAEVDRELALAKADLALVRVIQHHRLVERGRLGPGCSCGWSHHPFSTGQHHEHVLDMIAEVGRR